MQVTDEARRGQRLRHKAERQGLSIQKSRVRNPNLHDLGGYRVLDHQTTGSHDGFVVAGERFELDLDDVERFLAD